jgi:hypothetical protein
MVPVNYFAVLVAAILQMIAGAVWYGPLFGKEWSSYVTVSPERTQDIEKNGRTKLYIMQGFAAIMIAYMLEHAVIFASAYLLLTGLGAGLLVGVGAWIGFVAPVTVGAVLWEGKPWRYWMILTGYYLVTFVILATLFAYWR